MTNMVPIEPKPPHIPHSHALFENGEMFRICRSVSFSPAATPHSGHARISRVNPCDIQHVLST